MDPTTGKSRRRWLRLTFAFVTAGILLFSCEGAAHLLLNAREAFKKRGMREEQHCRYDPELGWANVPDLHGKDLFGPGIAFTTNHDGIRALHEFTPQPPPGRLRIACLGDSFTEGYGVGDTQTYVAQMEQMAPQLETMNLGLGGYGVDQSWLWWRRERGQHHAQVLLCAWIVFDFLRMNTPRFQGEYPKPFLVAHGTELEVTNVPVPQDWNRSAWLRPLKSLMEESALFQVLQKLIGFRPYLLDQQRDSSLQFEAAAELVLDEMAKDCAAAGTRLVLVWLPIERQLPITPTVRAWLEQAAVKRNLPLVDLTPEFRALGAEEFRAAHLSDGHYSAQGHQLVAKALLQRLRALIPEFPR